MIYTGDRQDRPKELTLSKEFFGGRKTAVEVTVKMLYGEEKTDVIGQYVRFCKVFNIQVQKYGLTEMAIQETIRICKDENVLKEYLAAHEKEVTGIMMALFNEETIQKAYGQEKFDEGKIEGRIEGKIEGKDEQAKTTALNLHQAGMADSMIAKMIGYAESVVSSWVAQSKTKTV